MDQARLADARGAADVDRAAATARDVLDHGLDLGELLLAPNHDVADEVALVAREVLANAVDPREARDVVRDLGRGLVALAQLLGQQATHDRLEACGGLGPVDPERIGGLKQVRLEGLTLGAQEGHPTRGELVEHAAHGVEIRGCIERAAEDDLGGHVARRADQARRCAAARPLHQPEIHHLEHVVRTHPEV